MDNDFMMSKNQGQMRKARLRAAAPGQEKRDRRRGLVEGTRFALVTGMMLVLIGCKTDPAASTGPRPGEGAKEYKQLTTEALTEVRTALHALEQVEAESPHCTPKLAANFSRDVKRLEVDSIRIRSRTQAIRARGDAYFADWSGTMARVKDPEVRRQAEQFRPELEESFSKIKIASQEAGDSFKPFLHGLRQMRVKLEAQPGGVADDATKKLIQETLEHGKKVVEKFDDILDELHDINTMLKPGKERGN